MIPFSGAPSIFSSSLTLSFTACLVLILRFSSSLYCDTETNMGSHTSDENIYLLARDEAETERYVPLALKCALLEPAFNRETRKPLPLEVTPFSGVSLSYHSQHIISTLRHAPSPSTPPASHTVTVCWATYPCQCQLSQQVPWAPRWMLMGPCRGPDSAASNLRHVHFSAARFYCRSVYRCDC